LDLEISVLLLFSGLFSLFTICSLRQYYLVQVLWVDSGS
jgi:hypothetical protein